MKPTQACRPENLHYLKMLARQYPTVQAASTEIINLQAILNLPKGTEHFVSDLHGEYEAFLHILNSASGVVREKLDDLFAATVSKAERDQLATLIYYPREKLEEIRRDTPDMREWYRITFHRLIELCRLASSKYTRSKVRKAMPKEYAYILDEMLHTHYEDNDKRDYYENIISTIIDIGRASDFLVQLCELIKRLAVDHLHVVGDIFDRGPRADIILDSLLDYHSVDIQWGNHDVLWMGAASGSRTLVASGAVQLPALQQPGGHRDRLRHLPAPLVRLRQRGLQGLRCEPLRRQAHRGGGGKVHGKGQAALRPDVQGHHHDPLQAGGQKILRNPAFRMADRLLLDKVDYEHKTRHGGRQGLSHAGHRLPHRGSRRSLYPHPRGGDPDPPADPLLPPQREAPAARALPLFQGQPVQDLQRQPALPRVHPHGGGRQPPHLPGGWKDPVRQGLPGLRRSHRPPGLLLRPRFAGAGGRHGLSVVPVAGRNSPSSAGIGWPPLSGASSPDESTWA